MDHQNARWSNASDVIPMFPTLVWKIGLSAEKTDQVVVRVKNETMLLFPAYLQHSVDASASDEERISISFNIMFSSFTKNLSKPLW